MLAATLAVAASGAPLLAHDTWLLPDRFRVAPGAEVVYSLTSGMEFPKNDHAVAADRIESARLRLAGTAQPLADFQAGTDHLAIRVRLDRGGIAGLALSSKPREIAQGAADVGAYFDEIGAPDAIRRAWSASGATELRELYRKHATSFVRVGEAAGDESFREPLGLAFELVPESDPTRLSAGEKLTFVARFRGAPLAGASVTLIAAAGKHVSTVVTDAAGKGVVELPGAGLWLLEAVQLRPPVDAASPWTSDFTTLSFEVAAAPVPERPR